MGEAPAHSWMTWQPTPVSSLMSVGSVGSQRSLALAPLGEKHQERFLGLAGVFSWACRAKATRAFWLHLSVSSKPTPGRRAMLVMRTPRALAVALIASVRGASCVAV